MPTCAKCGSTFPNRIMVDGSVRVVSKRRFCLRCSPFGKHNTRDLLMVRPIPHCRNCGKPVRMVYCNHKCQHEFHYHEYIRRWKQGDETGNIRGGDTISPYVRRYLMEKHKSQCQLCGWGLINPVTQKTPLTVEHKDGDATNTTEDNLALLCPNCHSLTPTYGALNKGNGRDTRRVRRAAMVQR